MVLHHIFTSAALSLLMGAAIAVPNLSPALAEGAPQSINATSIPQWMQPLKLTAAQIQKMNAIRGNHQAKILQNTRKLRQAQQDLEALLVNGAPDTQLRQKFRQVQISKYQLDEARFEVTLEMQDVLTAQQRQALTELSKKRLANVRNQLK